MTFAEIRARDAAWALRFALVAPVVAWLSLAAVIGLASLAGYRAFAAPADLTLPEAAALRDEADALRQIRAGADPNLPALIRRGILSDPEFVMTPLEAAVAARHDQVVRLLVDNGALVDVKNWPVLFCLALERSPDEVLPILKERAPTDVPVDCDEVRLPF